MVRPVAEKYYMTPEQLAALDAADKAKAMAAGVPAAAAVSSDPTPAWQVALAWVAIGIPLAWGVWVTLQKAAILFGW
jgi:hypothetical protein